MKSIKQLTLLLFLVLLAACGSGEEAASSAGQLRIVATTGQIADAAANVAGEAAEVTGLFGPGVDPHLYVPTEGDVTTLGSADIIFYNGLHLEAQFTRVMNQLATTETVVVALGDALPEDRLLTWSANTPYDPHFWNDPALFTLAVEIIRDTLVAADPDNAGLYQDNAAAYLAEIQATDAFVREQISRIPEDKRVMITAHDAFGYFGHAFGLEVRALQGISTETEAGTNDVQQLADFIAERQIPAIFIESSVPPNTIEAVQAAVSAQGFAVAIGGELFSDALGTPGTPEGTYIGMLRHNAQTLADALSR
jgi:manganese/zinc/iron transport system substrate-binding protein